jgi:hypothetical protein
MGYKLHNLFPILEILISKKGVSSEHYETSAFFGVIGTPVFSGFKRHAYLSGEDAARQQCPIWELEYMAPWVSWFKPSVNLKLSG